MPRFSLVLVVALAPLLLAAGNDVTPPLQVKILTRLLGYDFAFEERVRGPYDIVILFKGDNPASQEMAATMAAAFAELPDDKVRGRAVQIAQHPYPGSREALTQLLKASGADAVYVCTGLGDEVPDIAAATRAAKATSFAGRDQYVSAGLAMGVFVFAGQPKILLNAEASRAEGTNLNAQVMALVQLIK